MSLCFSLTNIHAIVINFFLGLQELQLINHSYDRSENWQLHHVALLHFISEWNFETRADVLNETYDKWEITKVIKRNVVKLDWNCRNTEGKLQKYNLQNI